MFALVVKKINVIFPKVVKSLKIVKWLTVARFLRIVVYRPPTYVYTRGGQHGTYGDAFTKPGTATCRDASRTISR